MDPSDKTILELFDLLQKSLDTTLRPEEKTRLERILTGNPALHAYYVRFFMLSSELRASLSAPTSPFVGPDFNLDIPLPEQGEARDMTSAQPDNQANPIQTERIRRRAERELQAFLAEQERQHVKSPLRQVQRATWDVAAIGKKIDRFIHVAGKSVRAFAVLSALLLVVIWVMHTVLSNRVVATLGQTSHAQWAQSPQTQELRAGTMNLEQGFAEIVFTRGARVLIQAPCRFSLYSPAKMSVEQGTVTAKVPREAIGFTIDTPISSIKDFGTEFGVAVDDQARTEVHVFDGRVQLQSIGQVRSGRNQWELTRNRSAIVDRHGHLEIGTVQERPSLFVRHLPDLPDANQMGIPGKRLDLADMVGGGNGLGTGILGQGLHPQTGRSMSDQSGIFGRAGGYVVTPFHEFIDGVFIPDAEEGKAITVSSTNLRFPDCPDTSGICAHLIRDGVQFQHDRSPPKPGRIKGQTYGVPGSPAIGMHANAGITFDLDKIRTAHGNVRITRFQSLCGISEHVADFSDGYWPPRDKPPGDRPPRDKPLGDRPPRDKQSQRITVGFWVLIDGRVRFFKELAAVPAESSRINIPLQETDRFLTLFTTEGHPDRPFAWSLFAEPVLELTTKSPDVASTKIESDGLRESIHE